MNDKQIVADHAANQVENNMIVGLGTGSTANLFIEALARRVADENLNVTTVSSSYISAIKARDAGLCVVAIEQLVYLDLYVDGADEVTPELALMKGQGSDLVREKLLANASKRFLVMVDQSKLVKHIGEKFAIPVEVLPFAWQMVQQTLEKQGGHGQLRPNAKNDGLAVTSHGSLVLDVSFDAQPNAAQLNELLNATPGVVEHGIFHQLADEVYVGHQGELNIMSVG
ncbi:MAG: ribose-5-phosphate isomerase RpiA [Gammaproteobacteria bacterium]|nr:ribose-5-phosphate isomerase RpiA [Gammaproteobacteria bacterium]